MIFRSAQGPQLPPGNCCMLSAFFRTAKLLIHSPRQGFRRRPFFKRPWLPYSRNQDEPRAGQNKELVQHTTRGERERERGQPPQPFPADTPGAAHGARTTPAETASGRPALGETPAEALGRAKSGEAAGRVWGGQHQRLVLQGERCPQPLRLSGGGKHEQRLCLQHRRRPLRMPPAAGRRGVARPC